MTKSEDKPAVAAVPELLTQSPDGLREIVRNVMQEMLEAEMADALGAGKGERTAARLGSSVGEKPVCGTVCWRRFPPASTANW